MYGLLKMRGLSLWIINDKCFVWIINLFCMDTIVYQVSPLLIPLFYDRHFDYPLFLAHFLCSRPAILITYPLL